MTVTIEDRSAFTLENFRRIAAGGEDVLIGEQAVAAMAAARATFEQLLESDRTAFIYGTTTRGGDGALQRLTPEEQREMARETEEGRHPGWGFGERYLEPRVVRGIIFARLANYVEGHAKSRPVVAQRIASMLEEPLPEVPLDGQVGAGEVLPLSHVMFGILGSDLREGEPMAVINGSPCAAALAADAALHARNRLDLVTDVLALSIEAFNMPLDAYGADLDSLYGDRRDVAAVRGIRDRLTGVPNQGRRLSPAPASYRIVPRVLAECHRAVDSIEATAETALQSVTDNPVYLLPTPERPLGAAISTGGYHNSEAIPALNALSAAWANVCILVDRQTTKLHDSSLSELPDKLMVPGSAGYGTAVLGFTTTSFAEEARHAAQRTLLPISEGGGYAGQNDVPTPVFLAYDHERRAAECVHGALAILAVSASQALWVTDRQPPPALEPLVELIRRLCPPVKGARGDGDGEGLLAISRHFAAVSLAGAMPAAESDLVTL
jgi:histidine ammonia-lyase